MLILFASDLSVREGQFLSGTVETRPLELFEKAGALVGLAGVEADVDMVVRHFPQFDYTLLSEAALGKEETINFSNSIIFSMLKYLTASVSRCSSLKISHLTFPCKSVT